MSCSSARLVAGLNLDDLPVLVLPWAAYLSTCSSTLGGRQGRECRWCGDSWAFRGSERPMKCL